MTEIQNFRRPPYMIIDRSLPVICLCLSLSFLFAARYCTAKCQCYLAGLLSCLTSNHLMGFHVCACSSRISCITHSCEGKTCGVCAESETWYLYTLPPIQSTSFSVLNSGTAPPHHFIIALHHPNLLLILLLDVTGADVLPLALFLVSIVSSPLCIFVSSVWGMGHRLSIWGGGGGATYALVNVIPDAVGNRVVGPIASQSPFSIVSSSRRYVVTEAGMVRLQLECESGDEDSAEEHVVPADESAVRLLIFRSLWCSIGAAAIVDGASHH